MQLYEEKRCTPSLARTEYTEMSRRNAKDLNEFAILHADRSTMPRPSDFNRLYSDYLSSMFGSKNGNDLFEKLDEIVEQFNVQNKEKGGKMKYQIFNEEGSEFATLIVVVVTPLMYRVHKNIQQSGEIVFLDATSNLDEHHSKFFLMCTYSVAGGLPLAAFFTSDERESTLKHALQLVKECLPEHAFYGGGVQAGPQVFLTDNKLEERVAVSFVWPQPILLLCILHVLKAVWKWLCEAKNDIHLYDRPTLNGLVRKILYAENENDLEDAYAELMTSHITEKYENFATYFDDNLWPQREAWCKAYRAKLPVRGNHTQNYAESQFLVLKQEIAQRVKGYNINELIEMITGPLDNHYQNRLLSVANGSFSGVYSDRFKGFDIAKDSKMLSETEVIDPSKLIYRVPSASVSGKYYDVDMNAAFRTCPVGTDGSPCKHQFAIFCKFNISSLNFLPYSSAEIRKLYAEVAQGFSMPLCYYRGLQESIENKTSNILTGSMDGNLKQLESNGTIEEPKASYADELHLSETTSLAADMQENQSVSKEEALQALEEVMKELRMRVDREDQELFSGILKFRDRVRKKNDSQLTRAFHCFGNKYVSSKSLSFKAKTILRKAKKGHIHVQPESVPRRTANKSKTKQELVNKKSANLFYLQCNTTCTVKRKHSLSENIEKNEQSGKKQGHTMASRTKQILRKVKKGEPINKSKNPRKIENTTATGNLKKRKLTIDNKCDCNRGKEN